MGSLFRRPRRGKSAAFQCIVVVRRGEEAEVTAVAHDDARGLRVYFDDVGVRHEDPAAGQGQRLPDRVNDFARSSGSDRCVQHAPVAAEARRQDKSSGKEWTDIRRMFMGRYLLCKGAHEIIRGALAIKVAAQAAPSNPAVRSIDDQTNMTLPRSLVQSIEPEK